MKTRRLVREESSDAERVGTPFEIVVERSKRASDEPLVLGYVTSYPTLTYVAATTPRLASALTANARVLR